MGHPLALTELAYPSASDADAVKLHRVTDLDWPIPRSNVYEHTNQYPIGQRDKPRVGPVWAEMNFTQEIAGSGTAGTPPAIGNLLRALGFKYTNTPATSDVYEIDGDVTSNFQSLDLEASLGDAVRHLCGNAVGDASFVMNAGEPMQVQCRFNGIYTEPTEAALAYTLATAEDSVVCKGLTIAHGAETIVLKSAVLNLNNEHNAPNLDIGSTHAVHDGQLADQNPDFEVFFEMPAFSVMNTMNEFTEETAATIHVIVGGTAGNILTVDADGYMMQTPSIEDIDGIAAVRLRYRMDWAGANKMKLAFT